MTTLQRVHHSPLRRSAFTLLIACSTFLHLYLYILSSEARPSTSHLRLLRRPQNVPSARATLSFHQEPPVHVTDKDQELSQTSSIVSDVPRVKQLGVQLPCNQPHSAIETQNSYTEACQNLNRKAELLPELVHIPFKEAVSGEILSGWEDEWVSEGTFDMQKWGKLREPIIDFIYTWVNGSDKVFQESMKPYEMMSPLNDAGGTWLSRHSTNRYRDWDELRYSLRSVAAYGSSFVNKIQILVNGLGPGLKQQPLWLKKDNATTSTVQVLSHEEFFEDDKKACLPTFNSLTIENQIYNINSSTDKIFVLSDDMFLLHPHSPSDIHSPLFGPALGFKSSNSYNTLAPPTASDLSRFGEKPFLIYTSYLLNRRFGRRRRAGQLHFGHPLSRSVFRETLRSFPRPALKSATRRFRSEPGPENELGTQIYSWYAAFHYMVERHREAALWSYLVLRADEDGDGFLSGRERAVVLRELEEGIGFEGSATRRVRNYLHVEEMHEMVGVEGPTARGRTLWTSSDGPLAVKGLRCLEFDVDECLAPGFSVVDGEGEIEEKVSRSNRGPGWKSPVFSTHTILDRVARQQPQCGDCLLKLILNRQRRGLGPLLPPEGRQREMAAKALMRYRYSVVEPSARFEMVTDAEMVEEMLLEPLVRNKEKGDERVLGQLCLNDDVENEDLGEVVEVRRLMGELFESLWPGKSPWEI